MMSSSSSHQAPLARSEVREPKPAEAVEESFLAEEAGYLSPMEDSDGELLVDFDPEAEYDEREIDVQHHMLCHG